MKLMYFYKNIRINLYCKYLILLLSPLFALSYNTNCLANSEKIQIVTQNAYNFFNDKKDGKGERVLSTKNYQYRIWRLSTYIVKTLAAPDIIALQEIENYNTLNDLKRAITQQYKQCYKPLLLEGHKKVAINVGYLIACDFKLKNLSPLFKNKKFNKGKKSLFTRPPLYIKVCRIQCLHLINVHMRSMLGLKNKKKSHYVTQKRLQQAQTLARWVKTFQQKWPSEKLIILGDFNALKTSDSFVDVLGMIKQNLYDVSTLIPKKQRFSYVYKHKKQTLDYILLSQNLVPQLKSAMYLPINYKVSDHAALKIELQFK